MPPDLPTGKIISEMQLSFEQEEQKTQSGKYTQYLRDEYAPDTEIDEYQGPLGVGYVLFEYITKDSNQYCRKTNYGPETWFSSDWILLPKK